jgi:hypothetical protein
LPGSPAGCVAPEQACKKSCARSGRHEASAPAAARSCKVDTISLAKALHARSASGKLFCPASNTMLH